jgi:hypothetical protein
MEHEVSSSAFILTSQLERLEDKLTEPRSFNAIVEEMSSNNLRFTIILEDKTGWNRLAGQVRRLENSKEESRITLRIIEARVPTANSTAFESI